MIARPYQEEMVDCVFAKLLEFQSTLVVAATGVGKTFAAGMLCQRWPRDRGRILVLVNREELLIQMADHIRMLCPDDIVEVDIGESKSSHAGQFFFEIGRIVVASKDTLYRRNRLAKWGRKDVGLILVDEAHHCVQTNKTYARTLDYFQGYKLVGITAAADRGDNISLGYYFKSVAYVYDILQAINDSWLVPIQQQRETVCGWDLSEVAQYKGELSISQLDTQMRKDRPLHAIATAARKYALMGGQRRRCLIFTASVNHAERVAEILNSWEPGTAVSLDGSAPSALRKWELQRFRDGHFHFLCGMNLFIEGFDEPRIQVIVIGRPTCRRDVYAQMIGRGTRPWPDCVEALNRAGSVEDRRGIIRSSPKPSLLVVDMVGCSGQHKLITSLDILGGIFPPKVRDVAGDLISKSPHGRMEISEALRRARQQIKEDEAKRRSGIIMRAKLESRPVDPFCLLDIAPKREPGWFKGKRPSEKMLAVIQRAEIPVEKDITFWKAKQLIEKIMADRNAEPPTERQAITLAKFGFDPTIMNFEEAKEAIDLIQQNGWAKPENLPGNLQGKVQRRIK